MADWLERERLLLGDERVERLRNSRVLLFGVGGVGSYTLEALTRAGVGAIAIVDNDTVSTSNINRQLIADVTTVGRLKTEVAEERCKRINPEIEIIRYDLFADEANIPEIIDKTSPDYIVDAIDTVRSKLAIIREARIREIKVVSSMGTGAKLDPTRFRITDISKTHTCPLAKVMRVKLRELGINHLDVLFSDEQPIKAVETLKTDNTTRHAPGSVSFVPSAAGLIIASHVIANI